MNQHHDSTNCSTWRDRVTFWNYVYVCLKAGVDNFFWSAGRLKKLWALQATLFEKARTENDILTRNISLLVEKYPQRASLCSPPTLRAFLIPFDNYCKFSFKDFNKYINRKFQNFKTAKKLTRFKEQNPAAVEEKKDGKTKLNWVADSLKD